MTIGLGEREAKYLLGLLLKAILWPIAIVLIGPIWLCAKLNDWSEELMR